jgi:molybdopterin synthase catalytic subunit
MQVVGVVGPDPDPLVDRLTEALGERGPVGVVHHVEDTEVSPPAGRTRYEVGADGWRGRGGPRSIQDVLDRLARDHAAAILVGFPGVRVPQIVADDTEVRRQLLEVDALSDVPISDVLEVLEEARSWESLGSLVATVKGHADEEFAGAIATFTGRVRARDNPEDDRTEHLAFERYDAVAEERLASIREELQSREGVFDVRLHHRTGVVEAGKDIVFVVVLAGHREEAFATVEDGINRLKAEVPIFKKEVTVEDAHWVHEQS